MTASYTSSLTCDKCGKTVDTTGTNSHLWPPSEWVALRSVNTKDKHFCSHDCLSEFLNAAI